MIRTIRKKGCLESVNYAFCYVGGLSAIALSVLNATTSEGRAGVQSPMRGLTFFRGNDHAH